jgi:2'-5' RNA ligase
VPGNWHFTLRFLGSTSRRDLDQLVALLWGLRLGPAFDITLGGFGAFPSPRRAAVVWLGVTEGRTALARLAETVEAAVVRAGLPASEKPFSAHLTLSRLREKADVTAFTSGATPFEGRQAVTHAVLYRSFLGGGPPRYEALERFALD